VNSLSFCEDQTTSHVSSEFYTFRFLVGHVSQRYGSLSRKIVGTMVDVLKVMIVHVITCEIQVSSFSTLVRNESRYNYRYNEMLAFLTTKVQLLSPLLSDSPFLSFKSLFVFLDFRLFRTQNQDPRFDMSFPYPCQ
jgi:hypothetical protein